MIQLVGLRPFAKHASVMTVEKNPFPGFETSGNLRLSGTVERKAGDQKQHFGHGAERAASWLVGGIRREQCGIEKFQAMRMREIRMLLAIGAAKHIEISGNPSRAAGEQC